MHVFQQWRQRYFQPHRLLFRYGLAFASAFVVLVFRSLLHPVLGARSSLIVFLLAVLVTAWYSGSLPALITLALGAFLGNVFFDPPYYTFTLDSWSETLAVLFYMMIGVAIIYLLETVKQREIELADQIIRQTRTENALRMSEERFRLAVEALHGVIYDWDAATDTAYRSPGLFDLLGYQSNQITTNRKWWQAQMHPEDFERVLQAFQRSVAARAPTHSIEYRVRHKDGHYIWVWDNSRIIYDDDGRVIRLIGNTLSIDERKRLSDVLAQTEERFRVAFQNASDAMVMSDRNGIVVAANQAYCQLYGYPLEEVIGQRFEIIFPEAFREMARQEYQRVFNHPEQLPFTESTVQAKDGTKHIVEARPGFVVQNGQRMYMLSIIRDLTERKQAERELYARYQLTADLAHAVSLEEVGRTAVEHIVNYLGADSGNIYVYHASDNTFTRLYDKAELSPETRERWQKFSVDPIFPITEVIRHNRALWFSSVEEREAAYPATVIFEQLGALVMLPLVVASQAFGVIGITFLEERSFSEAERAFILSLVFQCAQAIERARLAEKARELAVMQERQRLARDLHDNVSQLLFSSSVLSEMLPRSLAAKPEKAVQQAEQLQLMVRGAMAEMRTLLLELRPENLIQTPLSNLLTQLSYTTRARQDAEISVTIHAAHEYLLPSDAQVAFYRIAQESVHNVIKHGQASVISIIMRQTQAYTALIVADDGRGFDLQGEGAGFGLKNMRERAELIGAQLDIKSQIGKGTRVRLLWKSPTETSA